MLIIKDTDDDGITRGIIQKSYILNDMPFCRKPPVPLSLNPKHILFPVQSALNEMPVSENITVSQKKGLK